jgi:hypothetical protein
MLTTVMHQEYYTVLEFNYMMNVAIKAILKFFNKIYSPV